MKIIYGDNIRMCDYELYLEFIDLNNDLNEEQLRKLAIDEDFECAYMFFNYFDKIINKYNHKFNQLQKGKHRQAVLNQYLNQVINEMKQDLAHHMHNYIKEKNGYIDSWPYPCIYNVLSTGLKDIDDVDRNYYSFNYFGTAIKNRKASSDSVINENHYKTPYSKEYQVFLDQLSKAELTYKIEKDNHVGNLFDKIKSMIINIPFILGIIIGILMLYWTYTNTADIKDIALMQVLMSMFQSESIILKVISFVPMVIVGIAAIIWNIAALIGWMFNVEKIIMPFLVIIVVGIFYGITEILEGMIGLNIKNTGALKDAKKTIKKINKNPKYLKLKKEYEENNKKQEALAKIWHDAWFDYYQK